MDYSFIMVVPTIRDDVGKILANVDLFFSFLPIYQICVIGREDVANMLPSDDTRFIFCHEDKILNKNNLYSSISSRLGSEKKSFRFGWYYQQFLKMAYALICKDDYYLLWDSDTVPVKKIEMINQEGKPYFDYKTEFHAPYFDTIKEILPGFMKQIKGSFISEHMLVNAPLMCSLIRDIEKCEEKGNNFTEIIFNSIPDGRLNCLCFSEFETYGTYVTKNYPQKYGLRKWKSMRYGGFFYREGYSLKPHDLTWLSHCFDAISFEKADGFSVFGKFVQYRCFRFLFSANITIFLSDIIRGYNKLIKLFIK